MGFGSGTSYYSHADGLGSITTLTTSSGSVATSYVYDSFGNTTATTGTAPNLFRYTGREFDSETGAYYYRARYYCPCTGRFFSEDPIGFEAGMDFYVYAQNSAVNLVDPFGLKECCPQNEWESIKRSLVSAEKFLRALQTTGTATTAITGQTRVLGVSGCQLFTIRRPGKAPIEWSQYRMTIDVDPDKQPCIYKCVKEHELVHQKGCQQMGYGRYHALSEAASEIPAYEQEIRCLKKLLRSTQ